LARECTGAARGFKSMSSVAHCIKRLDSTGLGVNFVFAEFIEACLRCDVDAARRIAMDPGFTLQEVAQIVSAFRSDQLDLLYRWLHHLDIIHRSTGAWSLLYISFKGV